MRTIIAVSTALLLAGCGFSGQPKPHQFENSRTFAMSKAAVWQDVTAWFAGQPNMLIRKSDEASGHIIAEATYPLNAGPADCGFDDGQPPIKRVAEVTVSVQPADPTSTTVWATAVFNEYRNDKWVTGSTLMYKCNSTGGLENAILAAVN